MRWGKRKKQSSSDSAEGAPKHAAQPAAAHKPSVKDFSDAELKAKIARIKMEQEFAKLTAPEVSRGRKIVSEILLDVGKQQAKSFLNTQVQLLMEGGLKSPVKAVAKAAVKEAAKAPGRQVMKLNPVHGLNL